MDERTLRYLVESQQAWKPDEVVVKPWETGLTSKATVQKVNRYITTMLIKAIVNG